MNTEKITAYEVVREEELPDIHSNGILLRHKKTGARVMLVENDDENKVFNIVFRTPPKDSTGVSHILEHSVLCGSKEFPLKDPFVELVKGSLNTFLNAITYSDKTCYPVASCNDQDFQNLMHVYLDAVFYPNIYKKEEIFLQEGWHYHLEDVDGSLTYNGVVYNEMKGAFSSADDVLERAIMNSLFPDTAYGNESGGDPEVIPDLTYEEFLNAHRRFYHPANSFIYLYGNMDMEEKLRFLDEHYLSGFEAATIDSVISVQPAFSAPVELSLPYPVSETEGESENTYLSYNKVIGEKDPLICTAFDVLDYALLSAPGAPMRKAFLEAGIGKESYGFFDDGILQPYFSIVVKGADEKDKEEFLEIIRTVLVDACTNGVDKKAVKASINSMEFRYREADYSSYPKGLMYSLDVLDDWLYSDRDPFAHLKQLAVFERLKEEVENGLLERLIRDYLLDNPHGSIVTLVPSVGLQARREKELAEKLEALRASLSREELEQMKARTEALAAFQDEEDPPELAECLPMLTREDIRREIIPLSNTPIDLEGTLLLHHDVVTNGIGYLTLMFEFTDFSDEEIHYLSLLKSVLGYVDTEHFAYGDLRNEINANSGGLFCGVEIQENDTYESGLRPMFAIRGKALYHQMSFWFRMAKEILHNSNLDDTIRLKEIISELVSQSQSSMVEAGHSTAVLRANSYSSKIMHFQDELSGVGFYRFLEELEQGFETKKNEITTGLKRVLSGILRPEKLIVDYTGEPESLEEIKKQVEDLRSELISNAEQNVQREIICTKRNEGFKTASQVQYVAQAGNFGDKGLEYTGALEILKLILNYDYLWNNIRVKGGAYGCMSGFRRRGTGFFASYRDPHLARTLEVFRGIPEFIRNFDASEREMTKYIIGTISGKDVPRTPQMQGAISKSAWFDGITEEQLQKQRDQILSASPEDIRALAPYAEAILEDQQICVVGGESALSKHSELFMEVTSLISEKKES